MTISELEKSFWRPYFSTKIRRSHDIRVKSKDLNLDGKKDLILFSVARNAHKGSDKNLSNVQTYINKGKFEFFDETESYLYGYRNRTNSSYVPVLTDLNSDGYIDIYSSEHDHDGFANSLQIFLSNGNGKLVAIPEAYSSEILSASANSEISTVLIGPNKQPFIVRHVELPGYNKDEYLAYRPLLFQQ